MSDLLNRFSLQAVKLNAVTILEVIFLWLFVVGCVISSILSQPFTKRHRWFWIILVTCVPLIGVLAYLPFSFRKEELPHVFLSKGKKEKQSRRRHLLTRGDGPQS